MSRPDDVIYARDINAADAVIREIVAVRGDRPNGVHDWREERDLIARALGSAVEGERERCALIADHEAVNPPAGWPYDENLDKERGWETAAKSIAAAIRQGSQPSITVPQDGPAP